jgi:phenylalanine-4-hydroxylase
MTLKEVNVQLRGDYAHANPDMTLDFKWEEFKPEHHDMWRFLYARAMPVLENRACREYLEGIKLLGYDSEDGIPHFDRVNEKLMKLTGWQIVTVPGLVPAEHFFPMLAARKFPMTAFIRTPQEVDYLQEPDVFHEMFGHVAMLANPLFADYSQAFGAGGVKAQELGALEYLEALYWFTIEFGLINTPDGRRIYGGGITSSVGESIHALSDKATHVAFDVKRIMRQKYRIDSFQHHYFVIDSFEQLLDSTTPDFTPYYEEIRTLPLVAVEELLPTDHIIQRGVKA